MKALTIKRKKYGVNIQEIYFSSEDAYQASCDLKVDFCVPNKGKNTKAALTAVIDLTEDLKVIFANFRSSHRRGIQTTLTSSSLSYQFITKPSAEDIQVFCKYYDNFASEKNLSICNQNKLEFFAGKNALILTNVSYAHTNELICLHAFICNNERARLLYSISNFRTQAETATERRVISKIHRSLHWFEMMQFKKMNYKLYDLGGLAIDADPELENINHFKRGFGGQELKEYINFTPKTLKGWLAMRYLMKKL